MSEIALHPGDAEFSGNFEILRLIGELRDVFENNFDRTWFSLILDGIPVDLRTVRNIRDLVSLTTIYPGEEWQIMAGDPGIGSLPCHGEAVSPPRPQGEARDLLASAAEKGQGPAPVHPSEVRGIHLPLQPGAPAPSHPEAEGEAPRVLSVPVLTVVHSG